MNMPFSRPRHDIRPLCRVLIAVAALAIAGALPLSGSANTGNSYLEKGCPPVALCILLILSAASNAGKHKCSLMPLIYAFHCLGVVSSVKLRLSQCKTDAWLASTDATGSCAVRRTNNSQMRDGTAFVSVPQSYATFLNACSRGLSSSAMYLEVHPSTPKTTAALIDEGPAVITHTRAFSLRPLMLHARSDQSEPDVDHYQVLSLPHDCSEEDIKRRHEELKESLKSLPSVDRRITKKIKEAYKVLSNPTSRAIYDEKLKRTEAEDVLPDDGEDVSDEEYSGDDDVELFALPDSDDEIEVTIQEPPNKKRSGLTGFLGNLFGFNNEPGLKERTRPRSNDISTTANTELRHLIFGGTVKVSVEKFGDCPACNSSKRVQREYINTCAKCQGRGMISKSQRTPFGYISTSRSCMSCNGRGVSRVQDCSNCNNTGRVQLQSEVEFEVPAGARAGSVFKVKGRGHSGGYFSRPGDLFVKVETDENGHEFIDGDKVYTTANVDYVLAILGGTLDVETFCGRKQVAVPPRTQNGDEVTVGDYEGMTHIIKFTVSLPSEPSPEEISLLSDISKLRQQK